MKRVLILLLFVASLLFSRDYLSEDSEYLDVYVEKIEDGGGYSFYGDNSHFVPMFISLGFTKLTNLKMDRDNPSLITLQPGEKGTLLFILTPISSNKSYSFTSRLLYSFGDPLSVKPDDYIYTFPFEHGKKFKIDQGYGGKSTHKGENFYALDFSMDIGTPVHAARSGIVVDVKEDSNRGGSSQAYAKYGNYISVFHDDGTFASYVHLKLNGSIVEVGDRVEEGEHIGYSGNTGLSTGPHLHFAVNIPSRDGGRESIPVKFYNHNNEVVNPLEGESYYSRHRGREAFDVVFGKELKNSDYESHYITVKKTGKLEIWYDSIDSTTIIYCKNGKDKEIEAEFKITGSNILTSKKIPYKTTIPPLTEVFIMLVNPKNSSKSYSLNTNISYREIN